MVASGRLCVNRGWCRRAVSTCQRTVALALDGVARPLATSDRVGRTRLSRTGVRRSLASNERRTSGDMRPTPPGLACRPQLCFCARSARRLANAMARSRSVMVMGVALPCTDAFDRSEEEVDLASRRETWSKSELAPTERDGVNQERRSNTTTKASTTGRNFHKYLVLSNLLMASTFSAATSWETNQAIFFCKSNRE